MAGILTGILTTATDHITGHIRAITGAMIRIGPGTIITRITIITTTTTIITRITTIMQTPVVTAASTTAIAVL